jgi:hypothetical protein
MRTKTDTQFTYISALHPSPPLSKLYNHRYKYHPPLSRSFLSVAVSGLSSFCQCFLPHRESQNDLYVVSKCFIFTIWENVRLWPAEDNFLGLADKYL